MTTKAESYTRIDEWINHETVDQKNVKRLREDAASSILVARIYEPRTDSYTYLASTHWGSDGALMLRTERHWASTEGKGPYSPSWSSGGVCSDATAVEIAQVMTVVWQDALMFLRTPSLDA